MATSSPPPSAVPWTAATTGLAQPSMQSSTSWNPGSFWGLPNSVMSAPAMKVRPAQAITMALTPASAVAVEVDDFGDGGHGRLLMSAETDSAGLTAKGAVLAGCGYDTTARRSWSIGGPPPLSIGRVGSRCHGRRQVGPLAQQFSLDEVGRERLRPDSRTCGKRCCDTGRLSGQPALWYFAKERVRARVAGNMAARPQ